VQPRILKLEGGRRAGDPDRAGLYSAGQALARDGRAFELGAGEAQAPQWLLRREVFGVCGAACLLRRELFDELGGYDESYFAFYEDVDLNIRARIAGWRFGYAPEAVVWHLGNASWMAAASSPGAWNARLVARNRIAT
jgi:GT2 family glycosyltransferase